MINMIPVQSTLIASVGYNVWRMALTIQFQNGSIRRYSFVHESDFVDLMTSKSKGRFFNKHIKGRFRSRKLQVIGQK